MIEEAEGKKIDLKLICNFVILVIIGMMLTIGYLLYSEYSGAKEKCLNSEGEFEFDFPAGYFCNGKQLLQYEDGWDFKREFNISESKFRDLYNP